MMTRPEILASAFLECVLLVLAQEVHWLWEVEDVCYRSEGSLGEVA